MKVYSATGLDLVTRHTPPRFGGVRLPRLADPARRDRRARPPAPGRGVAGSPSHWASGAVVPVFLAFGTHNPVYRALWHVFPRSATRACPSGCCRSPVWPSRGSWQSRSTGRSGGRKRVGCPLWCSRRSVAVVLLADLHVRVFHPRTPTRATRPTTPYGRRRRAGSSSSRCSSPTSTTGARTSTTNSGCAASGRSGTRRQRPSGQTWSRVTSSRCPAATGRPARGHGWRS